MPRFGEDVHNSAVMPQYSVAALRKQTYFASTQAVATLTVGLATTYTGLCLSNPQGSNVDLHMTNVSIMQSVIQATQIEAYAIAVGMHASSNVAHTTPALVYQGYFGAAAGAMGTNNSVAKVDTAATLPTAPVYARFLTNTPSATTNAPGGVFDLDGELIIGPGGYAVITAPAQASVAGVWFSFSWVEVPNLVALRNNPF
jgi:hypothetical protein